MKSRAKYKKLILVFFVWVQKRVLGVRSKSFISFLQNRSRKEKQKEIGITF